MVPSTSTTKSWGIRCYHKHLWLHKFRYATPETSSLSSFSSLNVLESISIWPSTGQEVSAERLFYGIWEVENINKMKLFFVKYFGTLNFQFFTLDLRPLQLLSIWFCESFSISTLPIAIEEPGSTLESLHTLSIQVRDSQSRSLKIRE